MNKEKNSVQGFKASAVRAGFKKDNNSDMALIVSDVDAVAAGIFTANKVKAASVVISKKHVESGSARAIIANAGNANACTGKRGIDDVFLSAKLVADGLGIDIDDVMVASTGVIGLPLDMDKYSDAVPRLIDSLSSDGLPAAAEAIMTTDSFQKISTFDGTADGKPYRITGIAKGAGMIMPDMATMLCFIVTDIRIDPAGLKKALVFSAEKSLNRISVDGDTSTNDMVIVMANGLAGNKKKLSSNDYASFQDGLLKIMEELAVMLVKDGEGASKLVHVKIKGAASPDDALTAARTISNSPLVKTALYGQDPNWGRIMAAVGRSGVGMHEEKIDIWIDDIMIVEKGLGKGKKLEEKAADKMKLDEFSVVVDLHEGDYSDHITTCDFTPEYIAINADYRT
jgi:glutamate N-acetyltransferase/amino-acid N-acetyltransferase